MTRRLTTFAQVIGLAGALLLADNALAQESGTAARTGRPANLRTAAARVRPWP